MMSVKRKKAAHAAPGDMLKIPYGAGKTVWGRVIYNDMRDAKKKRGLYLTVIDRDVAPGDDLADVAGGPRLLGPLHTGTELVKDGTWVIAGNIPPNQSEQALPYFEDRLGVVTYFFERVPDTSENRARIIEESISTPDVIPEVVRAARGLEPWYPGYDHYRSKKA